MSRFFTNAAFSSMNFRQSGTDAPDITIPPPDSYGPIPARRPLDVRYMRHAYT